MKLLAALFCIVLPLTACVQDQRARSVEKTAGVVMQASPDLVWAKAKAVVMSFSQNGYSANESTRIVRGFVSWSSVTVKVEPRDSSGTRTILRVSAQAGGLDVPKTAERVITAIQTAVLRQ